MIDLTKFNKFNPNKRVIGTFTDAELDAQKGKLPDEIIEFLKQEGKCTFGDDFLWAMLPDGFHEVFTDWGLKGKDCHAFMRSSFGSLLFYNKGKYHVLNAMSGTLRGMDREVDYMFNTNLASKLVTRVCFWKDDHVAHLKDLPQLKEDEIYAFFPAVRNCGNLESRKIQVVNMKEHLARMAKVYSHKTSDFLRS